MEVVLFGNAFMALTVACFSSEQIPLAILGAITTERTDLERHSQIILDAATYLDTTCNAIAYMRMATPLLLVAMHAPDHPRLKSAVNLFDFWSKCSMRGINALALDTVHRQSGRSTLHAGS
jgi:hypothetical protein